MPMSVTAVALRELHRIHQQLADLRERLDRGPKQIKAREANVVKLEADLAKAQADAKAARVHVDQKQLLLKSGETKIEDLRRKLNACGTNREYQALLEQIAADEMAKSVLEDEILESLGKIDEFQAVIKECQDKLAKGKDELVKTQQAVKSQSGALQTDVDRLEADLKKAEATLPGDFRDAYNRIVKSRGSDAMAQVDGESCGGCFQRITANTYNALAMGRAIFCQSCGRLLYLPEDRSPGRG
jgi:predicted  nucleic acid-binding Zn-ribbon protein